MSQQPPYPPQMPPRFPQPSRPIQAPPYPPQMPQYRRPQPQQLPQSQQPPWRATLLWTGLALGAALVIMLVSALIVAITGATIQPSSAQVATTQPFPLTPFPTDPPTATMTPQPTATTAPPTPTVTAAQAEATACSYYLNPPPGCQGAGGTGTGGTGVNGNPWGFDYNAAGGQTIDQAHTPGNFCSAGYFHCIGDFFGEPGYIDECADGTFSHSGGLSGACSRHGGEQQVLYRH